MEKMNSIKFTEKIEKSLEIKFSKKEILSKNNYSNTLFIYPSKH